MDRPRPPSNSADDATDEVWFEDVTFEVMVGYCRTPDSKEHPHLPYLNIPGERYPRCWHCAKFLKDMANSEASVVLLDVAGPSMDSSTALEASAEASVGVSPRPIGAFGLRGLKRGRGGAPQPAESTADVRRIALDGKPYTWSQYVAAYGDDAHRCWDEAHGPSTQSWKDPSDKSWKDHWSFRPAADSGDRQAEHSWYRDNAGEAQRFWDDASQLAVNEYAEPQPTASIDEETLLLPSIPEGAAASHVQAEDPWAIQDWRRHRDPRFVRRDACGAPVEDPAEDAREEAREARLGNHEPDGMPYSEHQHNDSDASQLAIDEATPHDDRDVNPDSSRGIPWPEEAPARLHARRPALPAPVPPVPCANEIPQRSCALSVGAIPWPKVAPPRLQEVVQCGLYQDAVVAWGFVTMRCIGLHYSHCMTQALQTITVRRATLSLEQARRSGRAVRAPPGEQASPVAPPDDRDVNPDSSSSAAPVSLANPREG